MIKRVKALIITIILKIKYKTVYLNGKIYKFGFDSLNNINLISGEINIKKSISMGKGSRLGVNKGGKLEIGSGCSINSNSLIICLGEIKIGDNVSFGPNVCVYDHDHAFNENGKIDGEYKIGKVKIGNNVWLGANVIILRNSEIGDNCVIGAGAIVKGSIPPNSLVTSDRNMIIKKLKNK